MFQLNLFPKTNNYYEKGRELPQGYPFFCYVQNKKLSVFITQLYHDQESICMYLRVEKNHA